MACPINSCISVQDVLDYKINGIAASECICSNSEEIECKLCLAIERISAVTLTNWCPEVGCKKFNGTGNCLLYFAAVTNDPVDTITSVIATDCDGVDTTLTPDNHKNWLEFCDGSDIFPCGTDNITVCGTWGQPMPCTIKEATLLLTLEYLSPGITGIGSSRNQVENLTWSDFSIKYRDISDPEGATTGFPLIDQMIEPLIPTQSKIQIFAIDNGCSKCCQSKGCSC